MDVAVCVPYVHLPLALSKLRDDIEIGAQDCGNNKSNGAYTGQVGSHQIKDMGCTWVIIGHSERREGFGMKGEPEALCAEKTKIAIENGLKVMFCIGEKKEEREKGTTMKVCAKQLEPLKKALTTEDWSKVAIAYEPVCNFICDVMRVGFIMHVIRQDNAEFAHPCCSSITAYCANPCGIQYIQHAGLGYRDRIDCHP